MKKLFFLLFIASSHLNFASVRSGFVHAEARDMIALCCSYTFLDIYGDDQAIIPSGYEKTFTSDVKGLDNKFQVYEKENFGVINLRGSTAEMDSWLENFYATMIPAVGTIKISGKVYPYKFACHDSAAVHSGYAYAIACLSEDIIDQIKRLNGNDIYKIYITGHSQGGALAQMLNAYLQNTDRISSKNTFKTYAFAGPMVGNSEFSLDYCNNYCGMSYNIVNPKDMVPRFPISYNDSTLFTKKEVIQSLFDPKSMNLKKKGVDGIIRMSENMVKGSMHKIGSSIYNTINVEGKDIVMPETVEGVNYSKLDELIEIPPREYPKILIDSTILDDKERVERMPKDENGDFKDDELYKNEPAFFQHKPYNYYVAILKMFFPEEYEKLEMKYIYQNL